MRPGGVALAFVVLALAFLAGCADAGAVAVASWTFEGPRGDRVAVTLPAHFDEYLPRAISHYKLEARAPLPAALRGRPLTLVLPRLPARVVLRVGGARAESLDGPDPKGYRTSGPHAWRIPESATEDGALDLELDVDHTWNQTAWFDTVPRLTPELDGGSAFLAQRLVHHALALAGGSRQCLPFNGYLYLVVFLTDRRRSNYGWFALTGLAGVGYPLFQTGLIEPYAGQWEAVLAGVSVSSAVVAEMHFAASYFGLPRPARAWDIGYVVAIVGTIGSVGYFRTRWGGAWTGAITVPALLAEARLFVCLGARSEAAPAGPCS